MLGDRQHRQPDEGSDQQGGDDGDGALAHGCQGKGWGRPPGRSVVGVSGIIAVDRIGRVVRGRCRGPRRRGRAGDELTPDELLDDELLDDEVVVDEVLLLLDVVAVEGEPSSSADAMEDTDATVVADRSDAGGSSTTAGGTIVNPSSLPPVARRPRVQRAAPREHEPHARPGRAGVELDGPAMGADDRTRDGQAEARGSRRVAPHERVEDLLADRLGDARQVVRHLDGDVVGRGDGAHLDAGVRRRVHLRVVDEVEDRLGQSVRVGVQRDRRWGQDPDGIPATRSGRRARNRCSSTISRFMAPVGTMCRPSDRSLRMLSSAAHLGSAPGTSPCRSPTPARNDALRGSGRLGRGHHLGSPPGCPPPRR
jgi:hypothetical protein